MSANCPICGRPFSVLDTVLSERDASYQCRHCWNRVHATGTGMMASRVRGGGKPRIVSARRAHRKAEKAS